MSTHRGGFHAAEPGPARRAPRRRVALLYFAISGLIVDDLTALLEPCSTDDLIEQMVNRPPLPRDRSPCKITRHASNALKELESVGERGDGSRRQEFHDAIDPSDAWLSPRLQMVFRPAATPIRDPVAKLGGQPVWLESPCWPLSGAYGTPMMFVGQFPVPGDEKRMAYLFVTDDDGTASSSEPERGDNALLVQPGGRIPEFLTVTDARSGPSLWRRGVGWDEHLPVESHIETSPLDPVEERVLEEEIACWDAERAGEFIDLPEGEVFPPRSYLGGRPGFWQPRVAVLPPWRFFFQIHGLEGWDGQPYALNFGGGTGYAFLSPDGREGRFYWDCV